MATNDKFGGQFGPLKRFGAIFFVICGVVIGVSGAKSAGTTMIVMMAVAVACLLIGVVLARASFAAFQKHEF